MTRAESAIRIDGATVLPCDGSPAIPDATVIVRGDLLAWIGPRALAPREENARVIDAGRRFLVPGLIDTHAHAEHAWELHALLEHGVTTIRNPATTGLSTLRALRAKCAEDPKAPRLVATGPPMDTPPSPWPASLPARTDDEVHAAIDALARAGADFVKLYVGMEAPLVRSAVRASHLRNLDVIGDLRATSWTDAARAGIDGLCHAVPWSEDLLPEHSRARYRDALERRVAHPYYRWIELSEPEGPELASMVEALRENDVVIDPTLVMIEAALRASDPVYREKRSAEMGALPEPMHRLNQAPDTARWPSDFRARADAAWPKLLSFVGWLHREGVTLVTGTDCTRPWVAPGVSLHRELQLLERAGLSPSHVLLATTRDAARALSVFDRTGTVTVGKQADLLLVQRDPRLSAHNLRSMEWVMRAGVVHPCAPSAA